MQRLKDKDLHLYQCQLHHKMSSVYLNLNSIRLPLCYYWVDMPEIKIHLTKKLYNVIYRGSYMSGH